jgi:hypothetical protein
LFQTCRLAATLFFDAIVSFQLLSLS